MSGVKGFMKGTLWLGFCREIPFLSPIVFWPDFVAATSASRKTPSHELSYSYSNGIFPKDSLLGKFLFLVLGPDSTFKCSMCGSNLWDEKTKTPVIRILQCFYNCYVLFSRIRSEIPIYEMRSGGWGLVELTCGDLSWFWIWCHGYVDVCQGFAQYMSRIKPPVFHVVTAPSRWFSH